MEQLAIIIIFCTTLYTFQELSPILIIAPGCCLIYVSVFKLQYLT